MVQKFAGKPKKRRLKKNKEKLEEEEKEEEEKSLHHLKLVNIAENDIQTLPDTIELKERKTELYADIANLKEAYKRFDEDRRIYTYNDGYELGKNNRENMSDEELNALRNSRFRDFQSAKDAQPERQPKVYRNNGLRPHQALRKAITDGFNDN